MNTQEFETLKSNIETARAKKDRLEGQLEQLNERMKTEFGCNTLEELEVLYEDSKAQKSKLEKKFEENMHELQELTEGNL